MSRYPGTITCLILPPGFIPNWNLNRISSFPSPAILLKIYKVTILPILDYGCTVWGFCSKKNSDFLEKLQNKAMRIILRTNRLTCTQFMREKLGLLTLFNRRRYMHLQLVYRIVNDYNCPRQLQGYLVLRSDLRGKVLRDNRELHLPRTKTAMGSPHSCTLLPRNGMTSQQTIETAVVWKFLRLSF